MKKSANSEKEYAVVSVDKLVPYKHNPRKISQAAVDKVASSIREYGFNQPIVVDEKMVIICGHTRLLAAQQLGLKKVDVCIRRGLTEEQADAYRLADNRVAQESDWDDDKLRAELARLTELDFDISLTGFDDEELSKLFAQLDSDDGEAPSGDPDLDTCPECGQIING